MYRSSDQSESLQRDALISAFKKQLYELKDKEHQYVNLTDDVHNCETQYSMLKDDKQRKDNQFRMKADINRKNIADLRSQIDNLRMQIHKCSVYIEDVLRESAGIKRAIDNRENEIASIMTANQEIEAKNQQVDEENRSIAAKIKNLKEERNKADTDNQNMQHNLQQAINSLKALQKQARFLESNNNKLSSMLIIAEKDHSDLISEMRNRESMVGQTNRKLQQLNNEIEVLKEKIIKLEKDCSRNELQLKNATQDLEQVIARNKEQVKKIKQTENSLRGIENQLDKAVLQRDNLENDNASFHSEHKLLNEEVDSILRQIIECERANNQLKKQIQNYIQFDEEARNMLDRKAAMRKMLETVTNRLGQTGSTIAHLR